MATNTQIPSRGASRRPRITTYLLALGLAAIAAGCGAATASVEASAAPASGRVAPASPTVAPPRDGCFSTPSAVEEVSRPAPRRASRRAYGWPLKPFNRQHPIRGFFNDPRNGDHGSHSFHFGVDIAAADGTPVYAVLAGRVHRTSGRAVAVVHSGGWSTAYWHIVPVVSHGQRVRKHQLLGRIEASWGHVHFAELRNGDYVNPLRRGALGPYVDSTTPTIADARFRADRHAFLTGEVRGTVSLVVDAFDTTPVRVPAPWNDLPVTPARLRWRVVRENRVVVPWRAGVDFQHRLLPASRFDDVYAPPSRKNYPPVVGRYCFYVARGWDTRDVADGAYRVQIEAVDTRGNRTVGSMTFTVANGS